MVLHECLLPPTKGSTLLELVLFDLLCIQNMEISCHHNSVCHLKLFSNALTLPRLSRICKKVFEGKFCCRTCSKLINLGWNVWCKQHFCHLKGLIINTASFFNWVFNITIKEMPRWLNSQEFCTLGHANLIISLNTVIFLDCLRIMDMKSTTNAVFALDAFENLKSPFSSQSSNFLTKAALSGLHV